MTETGRHDGRTSTLDISDAAFGELAARAVELVRDYFARVGELPVFPQSSAGEIAAQLPAALPVEPAALEELMADCRRVMEGGRHSGHPRFFGYVASPSTPVGAFADLIASAVNQNVPAWRSAPSATQVEKIVVRWLAELIGYAEGAGGLLTSGGSLANLSALYVAHRTKARAAGYEPSRRGLRAAPRPMTLYVSDQAHMSIAKAADVLGLGREQVRVVETDGRFRLDVRALAETIDRDEREGSRPFCVVASAGTVNTGAVDPLAEIAEVAAARELWFHVDGAYGAPAALAPPKRELFRGLGRADSVALDPHKWLYTPVDCGCLLLRDPRQARAAWADAGGGAEYIKIFEQTDDEQFAFFDYGPELSRRFRALKVWLLLRYYGAGHIARAVADDCALAAHMAELVEAADDFELLAPVELSICCFRHVPARLRRALDAATTDEERAVLHEELDALNERVMHAVQRGGRAYVSNASLRGRFALRACVTNFRTTRADVAATLEIIRAAAREMEVERGGA